MTNNLKPPLLVEYSFPSKLSKAALDNYLETAWFRNGSLLFRSRILCLEGNLSSVLNIRLPLGNYAFSKSLRKILRKNKGFEIKIGKLQYTPEKEALFELQKPKFKGFIHPNLDHFFTSGAEPYSKTIFNTYEIEVYDNGELIAASFFDVGKNSIASLLGIYNPKYNKNSLGIFTMLLELQFAVEHNKTHYYPGYILDVDISFDYKLRMGEMEYRDSNGKWITKERLSKDAFQGVIIKDVFSEVAQELDYLNVSYITYLYPFFTLGYVEHDWVKFNKSPIFILFKNVENSYLLLEYDADYQLFRLIVSNIYESDELADIDLPKPKEDGIYPEFLEILQEVETVIESTDILEVIYHLQELLD